MFEAFQDFKIWAFLRINGFSEDVAQTLVKVARLETGHYTSRGYVQANNPFGMGCVQKRPTTQTACSPSSDGVGIGVYPNVWAAVRDYAMWFEYWGLSQSVLSVDYWKRQNPKDTYRASVGAVADSLRSSKAIAALALPVTYFAVRAALKFIR